MMNKMRERKQPNFIGTVFFIVGLAIINLIVIFLNDYFDSKLLTFLGNTIGIGLLFPISLLYIERKEKFDLKRYMYFSILTAMATGIVMYLFVLRF